MTPHTRRWASAVALGSLIPTMGCGLLLGLDEFTDRPPGAGGGGGEPTECASPADCPAGEHGASACDDGACSFVCDEGFADCDGTVGCETSIVDNKTNCGGCGVTCAVSCMSSSCNDPVDITVAHEHACAALKDGSVWCWGNNEVGQLGDGTTENRPQPTKITLAGPAVAVEAGGGFTPGFYDAHTCAILADRTAQCWGSNSNGELGLGSTTGTQTPAGLQLENISQISVATNHACAININHDLYCWGANFQGEVGDGTTTMASSPVHVDAAVAWVSTGQRHTCAAKLDGTFYCWGSNSSGALGIGQGAEQLVPTFVGLPDVVEVSCGHYFTCARNPVGTYCWGSNSSGKLGLNDENGGDYSSPQAINLPGVAQLNLGKNHAGAVVGEEVYMWGANAHGQLGTGTAISVPVPTPIGLANAENVSLGSEFSCALTSAGPVLCWGQNTSGQLGDGTMISRSTPAPVIWP